MRSKRGITLVSLVVTIIVLIILAGVSINLTVGENGIITIAKKARENMELAKVDEERQLNELYEQIVEEGGVLGNLSNEEISQLAEFKRKIASAITDMGIETLETANADTMASNIRSIVTNKDAASISYDNTNSEFTSTNVQGALDEISDKSEWKFVGSTTGKGGKINLPTEFKELFIEAYESTAKSTGTWIIPKIFVDTVPEEDYKRIQSGNYQTSSINIKFEILVRKNNIELNQSYKNGADNINNTILYMYYR